MSKALEQSRFGRKVTRLLRFGLASALAASLFTTSSMACSFHVAFGAETTVDKLLGASDILLARPTPDNPFVFEQTQVIEGLATAVEIPDLVDTATRRRLAQHPNDQVLFVREVAYAPWRRIAYVGQDFAPVLDVILAHRKDWQNGVLDTRYETFAALLNHPNGTIRRLAYRELDKADYPNLKALPLDIQVSLVLDNMDSLAEMDTVPIRILLLGFSKNDEIPAFLEQRFDAALEINSTKTGAYATALIEQQGPVRAQTLIRHHLTDTDLSTTNRDAILEALALHHASGTPDMRQVIDSELRSAMVENPDLAAPIAARLGSHNIWSQKDTFTDLMQKRQIGSIRDLMTVSQYIALAQKSMDGATIEYRKPIPTVME